MFYEDISVNDLLFMVRPEKAGIFEGNGYVVKKMPEFFDPFLNCPAILFILPDTNLKLLYDLF